MREVATAPQVAVDVRPVLLGEVFTGAIGHAARELGVLADKVARHVVRVVCHHEQWIVAGTVNEPSW